MELCEKIAHLAGFQFSVGNWIAPTGELICGENYEDHHWQTITRHLGESETDNSLRWMNDLIVNEKYIRLVFRVDVLFQVGAIEVDEIWGNQPNYIRMISILKQLNDIDVHIFSMHFYIIGHSNDVVDKNMNNLQIRKK